MICLLLGVVVEMGGCIPVAVGRMAHAMTGCCIVLLFSIVPPIHPPIHSSVLRASTPSKLQLKRQLETSSGDNFIHGIFYFSLRIVNSFSLQANNNANKTNKQTKWSPFPLAPLS